MTDRRTTAPWTMGSAAVGALVVLPVAFLATSILSPSTDVWAQQWRTRLPEQLVTTTLLLVGTVTGAVALGAGLAWMVTAYRFPLSRAMSWLLIVPLAMPGYILGFLMLSTFGRTGTVQDQWRTWFGPDAWFPDVESLGGAVVTFTLVLYPYVFLLARAALRDQAADAYHAARTLGAGPVEAARRVVLPLLRPALAAGGAIVAMETLTDFATVQYFGVDTVSVGVFRVWRGTYDRDAAAELATLVLAFALLAIGLERVARGRARYGRTAATGGGTTVHGLRGAKAVAATAACATVVTLAFLAPVAQLVWWAVREQRSDRGTPLLDEYPSYLRNSLQLAAISVAACMVLAVVVANAPRFGGRRTTRVASRAVTVGYAVPGPVVGIGVLLLTVAVDGALERIGGGLPGVVATGSIAVLVYAYVVRFLAPGVGAVESGLAHVPDEMTASSRVLGAGPARTMWRVHLPLSGAALLTAAVLVAVDAVKELPIVLLLRPFGFDTLPVWVHGMASESRYQQAALPALTIVLVALVPVAVLARRLERRP